MYRTQVLHGGLRYRRPYWMLFLQGADNWKIYTKFEDPDFQRTELLYQAWLGGLDRPYSRPLATAFHPLWLQKKRHLLEVPALKNPETPMERYVLDWHEKFFSFRGTARPTVDDLHTAFDLVERPLDLSYAVRILGYCHNKNDIHFAQESFQIFLEACLRVGRKDVAVHAMSIHEKLGFWYISEDCRRYLEGTQSWYDKTGDGVLLPESENGGAKAPTTEAATKITTSAAAEDEEAELRRLEEELARLEKGGQ